LREREYLRQRYAAILSSIGRIFLIISAVMILPLVILPAYPEEMAHIPNILIPAGCLCLLGATLYRIFRPAAGVTLSVEEGGVIVLISWIVVIVFSAWPLVELLNMDFSRAVFESVSGWTTTGLSVVDVTKAGPLALLWRSVMQLAGGAGLAIIMMSAITGPTGVGISNAEGRGDLLAPHVKRSAQLVLSIYSCYAIAGTIAYWLAGMSLFDAVNQSFAAVSTGGFGTHMESIGFWDSPTIEAITLVLMILGNMSFLTAWYLFRGNLMAVSRNGEIRLMAFLIPISTAVVFLLTARELYPMLTKSFRVALFETISSLTTTGFSTVGYGNWNGFGVFVLTLLMLIGGGTCSTAGGIKQFRVYLIWKTIGWEIRRALLPQRAVLERPIWEGNQKVFVDDGKIRQIGVYVFLYMILYAIGTLILCSCGFSLRDSLFEFASSIGTVGLSIGVTSANMPDVALWAETIAMFLGRLEFFVVIVSTIKIVTDARRLLIG
jgi:trk system potassium uptake protein